MTSSPITPAASTPPPGQPATPPTDPDHLDPDLAVCATGRRAGGAHRLDTTGTCTDCNAVAPAALTQFGIPGCDTEAEDRELGCSLADGHPLPHHDRDADVDFTVAGEGVTDPADVIARFAELPAQLTAGLTTYGDVMAAQVRLESTLLTDDTGELVLVDGTMQPGPTLAALYLAIHDTAPVSPEDGNPARLTADDARRLRDLLNIATARGVL